MIDRGRARHTPMGLLADAGAKSVVQRWRPSCCRRARATPSRSRSTPARCLAAGNHGFRNCAALGAPWYGEACADGGTDIIVIKTAPAACAPGADCTFGVTITNTGHASLQRRRAAERQHVHGRRGAALARRSRQSCRRSAARRRRRRCRSRASRRSRSRPANRSLRHHGDDALGRRPDTGRTIASPSRLPALPPPALPPAPGADADSAVSCAWVPVGAPLAAEQSAGLKKTALHAGKCSKAPGDVILCDYEIDLINDGPSPFHGLLTVNETVPAAATLTVGDPTWACAGGPPLYACNPLAAVDIRRRRLAHDPGRRSASRSRRSRPPAARCPTRRRSLPRRAAPMPTSMPATMPTPPSPTRSSPGSTASA